MTGGADGARLYHVVSGKWSAERLPWAASGLGQPLPDGNGGFWLPAVVGSVTWIWHRTAAGTWSRIPFVPGSGIGGDDLSGIDDYAAIPRTSSLWAAGFSYAKAQVSTTATVWAYGSPR